MIWRATDPQGNEAEKIKWLIVPYTRGRGLDLGCGPNKAFPHFIGVDNMDHARQFGWQFKPDVVADCEKLSLFADGQFDFVFSSHLLEHIEDYQAALKEWFRVVKVGGYLVLYLPHRKFYPNIGQFGANPDHKHDFAPQHIVQAMMEIGYGWQIVERESRSQGSEYSFYQVYRKTAGTDLVMPEHRAQRGRACVVRYGGFGDMIQTSSIFPGLKAQGYDLTVMTTPRGREVVENNPYVDRYIIQDENQVPNHELGAYWAAWKPRFDKWVNLTESVEGTLLALPSRINHGWPHAMRHKLLNHNYTEFTHLIAEVPFEPHPQFYPTDDELEWALKEVIGIEGYTIMVVLAGSSVHKAWPNLDYFIARVMRAIPDATVILVGDHACQLLEAGWQNEPRVLKRSGVWTIRQTLTAALNVDMVIGPETGVMNAVSHSNVSKIVLLSHSSVENLSRDWVNCDSIEPVHTPCYPCHRLHYGREHCPELRVPVETHPIHHDPKLVQEMTEAGHIKDGLFATGAALCAASISPDAVFDKVKIQYEHWRADRDVQINS